MPVKAIHVVRHGVSTHTDSDIPLFIHSKLDVYMMLTPQVPRQLDHKPPHGCNFRPRPLAHGHRLRPSALELWRRAIGGISRCAACDRASDRSCVQQPLLPLYPDCRTIPESAGS